MPFLLDSPPLPAICPRCPRFALGALDAPFAPPALNNFRHPCLLPTYSYSDIPKWRHNCDCQHLSHLVASQIDIWDFHVFTQLIGSLRHSAPTGQKNCKSNFKMKWKQRSVVLLQQWYRCSLISKMFHLNIIHKVFLVFFLCLCASEQGWLVFFSAVCI